MRFFQSLVATAIVLPTLVSSRHVVPRAELDARGEVDACKAILIALKASAFCSSFVPINDVTATVTQTGTAASTQVTVTAPCTNPFKKRAVETPECRKKRQISTTRAISTTPAAPSTTPRAPSTTPAAPSTTRAISTTPAAPSTTPRAPSTTPSVPTTTKSTTASATPSKCSIKGLPPKLSIFACDVIKQACSAFVKPKTATVTTFQPGPTATGTKTVTPTCPITTTRVRQPSTTPATTPETTPPTTTPSTTPSTTPGTTPSTTTGSGPAPSCNAAYANQSIQVGCSADSLCTSQAQCQVVGSEGQCSDACGGNCIAYQYNASDGNCNIYNDCCT